MYFPVHPVWPPSTLTFPESSVAPDGGAGHAVDPLLTWIVMLAVAVRLLLSVAVAVIVCVPLARLVVSMPTDQLVVPVAVWGAPLSTLTWTWLMLALPWADAVPATVTVPETVLPLAGWVMLTDGGGISFPESGRVVAVQAGKPEALLDRRHG